MRVGTITPPLSMKRLKPSQRRGRWSPLSLRIKTLAVGVNEQGRFYHIGGEKGHHWYVPSSWTRSAPSGTAAKRSPAGTFIFRECTDGSQNRSATSVMTVCIRPLISSLDLLVESTVVIGDL